MLHVGVADKSDLHCSSAIFTWLSLQHNVTTCRVDGDISLALYVYFFSYTAC